MRPPQLTEDDPPFQDVILSVFQLSNLLTAAGDRLVADLGLTSARWQVLGALAAAGARPVAWLARDLEVSRQNIQRIVNDLDRLGLVAFQPNPHHKQAHLVDVTEEGTRILHVASGRARPWAEHAAAGIHSEDVEVARRVLHEIGTAVQSYRYPLPHEDSE